MRSAWIADFAKKPIVVVVWEALTRVVTGKVNADLIANGVCSIGTFIDIFAIRVITNATKSSTLARVATIEVGAVRYCGAGSV